jgi:hypothetical protein
MAMSLWPCLARCVVDLDSHRLEAASFSRWAIIYEILKSLKRATLPRYRNKADHGDTWSGWATKDYRCTTYLI